MISEKDLDFDPFDTGETCCDDGTCMFCNPEPPEWMKQFDCPRCRMITHNPVDVRERYCGNCHDWTGCSHDPLSYKGAPIGIYHCPGCGCMVLAGVEHLLCDPAECGLYAH